MNDQEMYQKCIRNHTYISAVLVHGSLDIHTHCTGALVEDGKLGLVVEQTGHLKQMGKYIGILGFFLQ